mmetsp:Transcript_19022/g.36812  ORF Transcript_19022/g.36812 Transcript_19022/m.36812 type:complete len:97 (-) Transcript_19022:220-510(-)
MGVGKSPKGWPILHHPQSWKEGRAHSDAGVSHTLTPITVALCLLQHPPSPKAEKEISAEKETSTEQVAVPEALLMLLRHWTSWIFLRDPCPQKQQV